MTVRDERLEALWRGAPMTSLGPASPMLRLREWGSAAARWWRAGGPTANSPSLRPSWQRYVEAIAAIALVTFAKNVSGDWLGRGVPSVAYLGAVMFAAWRGGLGPGLAATVLSTLASAYLFIAPYDDIAISTPKEGVQLAVTFTEGVVISALTHVMHTARAGLSAANREREYLAGYAELSPALIFEVDVSGRVTFANPSARQAFPDLVEQGPAHPLIAGVHEIAAPAGRTREVETGGLWFDEMAYAVPGSDRVRVYAADITDRKRLGLELLQLQKIEALGTLSGGIAHDFNNVLGIILGCLQLARREVPAGHPAELPLRDLGEAAQRAAELTKRLLSFARRRALRLENVVVGKLLVEFGRMLGRLVGEDVRLVLVTPREAIAVRVDIPQIEQALLNLCINARQAMPDGGELRVEARRAAVVPDVLRRSQTSASRSYVEIAIHDTGVGMDSDTRARMFEPFFTTKDLGTGLGLATTYAVILSHGGAITVDSAPGQGSTITVFLPISAGAVATDAAQPTVAPSGAKPATILLAEDEPSLRQLLADALRAEGHEVIAVGDGAAAIEAHSTSVSLVVLDLVMPRTGGLEAYARIRERDGAARFLFVSGYPPADSFVEAVARGELVLLEKPFTPRELVDAVARALE